MRIEWSKSKKVGWFKNSVFFLDHRNQSNAISSKCWQTLGRLCQKTSKKRNGKKHRNKCKCSWGECINWGVYNVFIGFFGNLSRKCESSGQNRRKRGGSKIQYFFLDQRNQSNAMFEMLANLGKVMSKN